MILEIQLQHAEGIHTFVLSQIPEFMQRCQDEIPGQTTVGPVHQAQIIPYLGINGIEIQIPSATTPDRNFCMMKCRSKNRYVDELHLNDPDHNPTISKLLLERFVAQESELCSTKMEQTHIGETLRRSSKLLRV